MSWNYKHCTPTGGGFNDGSSKDNAWTLSQMIANYAAGDWVWMYHDGTGFDTAATQYTFATSGNDAANVMFAGCGTVAGDGERCKIANPGGTQYSGMLRTNGSYLNFQNLWISKKDLNEAITITGRRNSFRNCIFESTQTTTGHPVNGSGNAMMFDGCVFVSAGYSTVASISNSAVLSNCVFLSLGALSTTQIFLGTFRDYTISNCLFIAPTAITGSDAITLLGTQFSQNDNIAIIRNSFYGMDNGIDFNPTATDSGRQGFLTFHGNVMDVQSYGIRNQGAATYAGGLSILGNAIKAGVAATSVGDIVDDTIILTESPFTDPNNYDLTLNRVAGGGLECIRGYIGAEARSTFNIPVDFNIGSAPEFNIIKAANEVRPTALVGHWSASLDDDGAGTATATDLTGNGHNGTKNGGLTEVSDPSFNGVRAWDMDGTGDYITVADDDAFTFVSGGVDQPFTISTWVRFNAINSGVVEGVVTKGDAADTGEWQITKFNTDLYWRTTDQSGGVYFGIGVFNAIIIGKWTHFACTYDGRTGNADAYKIYLDGVEVPADATSSNGTPSAMQNTTHPVLIGRRGTSTELDGRVDDTRIYNAVLSVDEIQALAASRVGREAPRTTTVPAIQSQTNGVTPYTTDTFNIPFPTGIQSGDLLLVVTGRDDAGTTSILSNNAGLDLLVGVAEGEDFHIHAKICDGTESGNITFTMSGTDAEEVNYCAMRISNPGVYGAHGFIHSYQIRDGSRLNPPVKGYRGRVENCLWIALLMGRANIGTVTSGPAGWTLVYEAFGSYSYGGLSIYQKTEAAHEQTGDSWTVTASANDWQTVVIAVAAQDNEVTIGGGSAGTPAFAHIG
jgi:hypothetical protein